MLKNNAKPQKFNKNIWKCIYSLFIFLQIQWGFEYQKYSKSRLSEGQIAQVGTITQSAFQKLDILVWYSDLIWTPDSSIHGVIPLHFDQKTPLSLSPFSLPQ